MTSTQPPRRRSRPLVATRTARPTGPAPSASCARPSSPANGNGQATPLLAVRGLRAGYEGVEVLHGVDLVVSPGTVHAVLGANGAGKTTMLKVIAGLHPPTAGEVLVTGRRTNGIDADALARRGLCLVPEGRGIFPNLTVRENLWLITHSGQRMAHVEETAYTRFPPLADRRNQVAGTLSGGEQQMLAMCRGLATDPGLLLLDELSMGLAPLVVEELYGLVAQIAAAGVSILVVEQFAHIVMGVADHATVMAHGEVVRHGTPQELESTLTEAYLGG